MKFRFTHEYPTVFHTLIHGHNAQVLPGDDREVPESTITLTPGDSIDIFDPADPHTTHPFLDPLNDDGTPAKPKPKPRRPSRRRTPAQPSTTPNTDENPED